MESPHQRCPPKIRNLRFQLRCCEWHKNVRNLPSLATAQLPHPSHPKSRLSREGIAGETLRQGAAVAISGGLRMDRGEFSPAMINFRKFRFDIRKSHENLRMLQKWCSSKVGNFVADMPSVQWVLGFGLRRI